MKTQKQYIKKEMTSAYRNAYRLIGIEISNNRMNNINQMFELNEYKACYPWEKNILKTRFKRLLVKVKKYQEKLKR